MQIRTFGRLGWPVSAVGYGMWGMGGWSDSDDAQSQASLRLAVELGCNFFDTALAYGEGKSERLLGELLRDYPGKRLYVATKAPPKNRRWPTRRGDALEDVFPRDHIRECVDVSLANLGTSSIDLLQFHVWEDAWAHDARWQMAVEALKQQKLVKGVGISINRWEPANVLATLRTGLIDAVQVIYNIFDQNPEGELFPLCRELNVAVIARVPFDEGSLTGSLTKDSKWPEGDWRNIYFVPDNLHATLERVEKLKPLVPADETLPGLAMRFVLANADVNTVIPGMRKPANVRNNMAAAKAAALPAELLKQLKAHRWERTPTKWSS